MPATRPSTAPTRKPPPAKRLSTEKTSTTSPQAKLCSGLLYSMMAPIRMSAPDIRPSIGGNHVTHIIAPLPHMGQTAGAYATQVAANHVITRLPASTRSPEASARAKAAEGFSSLLTNSIAWEL